MENKFCKIILIIDIEFIIMIFFLVFFFGLKFNKLVLEMIVLVSD